MIYPRLYKHALNTIRLGEIFQVFAKHGFYDILFRLGLLQKLPWSVYRQIKGSFPEIELEWGERLRKALTELGPTFIKMGQILSTRPDLVGADVAKELSLLQDRVEPMPFENVVRVIEKSLKKPLGEIYREFDAQPVAAGSLSQVHKAVMFDGSPVAVKVKRVGIDSTIESDILLLMTIAQWLEDSPEISFLKPTGIVKEFSRSIRRELDFTIEARIITQFRNNMKDIKNVIVPRVYKTHSTSEVLTMDWIDGVRVDEFEEYERRRCDRKIIARLGCEILCKMVCEHRFFHADPHPGNIFITYDNTIAFLDLGMAGYIDERDVALLSNLLMAVFRQDTHACVESVLALTAKPTGVDLQTLEHEISDFITFEAQQILGAGQVGKGIERAIQILRENGLELAPRFTLLLKALATVESVGRELDPDLDFVSIIRPYLENFLLQRYEPGNIAKELTRYFGILSKFLFELPENLTAITSQVRSGEIKVKVHHEYLEKLASTIDKSSSRISLSLLTAALIVGSSLLISTPTSIRSLGIIGFISAGLIGLYIILSILVSRGR
ncbi:MAG: AarF/ABC1/UbiB kinase family protein [Candidatus Hydrogenedentes bacterium]|nr:AarF/ABC1/UbiB kinase family protein [Candidatus Hydrogenedentota bacterium]